MCNGRQKKKIKFMKLANFFENYPEIKTLNVVLTDLNGVFRGKTIPVTQLSKVEKGNFRMPISVLNLDIWGNDIERSKWVFATGDADGKCLWTNRKPLIINWNKTKSAIIPVSMYLENKSPFFGDPRHLLLQLENKLTDKKLKPIVGIELEFYLIKIKSKNYFAESNMYSISEVDKNFELFDEISKVCEENDIKIESTISESGPGQFEIVLLHNDSLVTIAENVIFLKYIIRSLSLRFGYNACFMSKPFGDLPGSGLHVHYSILNEKNENIFDNGTSEGSKNLKYAIGGLIGTMPEVTLIMAPHLNSYRRIVSETHAPNIISWGYENRTVALRVPGGENKSRRIEHRVAGSDVNPYLLMASIILGVEKGIDEKIVPPEPEEGNAYNSENKSLPASWQASINEFKRGKFINSTFPKELIEMYLDCKSQECQKLTSKVADSEINAYLNTV